ncbi:MAG: cytidylate kinase family protein [Clostridia bacterium]|nr:cytidylate kinase family protein [Clostridia bacterium]MBR4031965.1 cytidylate kinase family protein [Clostridia bacterium]
MLMSITGKLGSGKSTVCSILKEKYGFEIFSTGTINREYARRLGITTLELNERLKSDPALDKEIDGTVTKLSIEKKDEKLVFDSRMAWHFAKDTFKIFLTIDPMEAATRVMKNQRGAEEHYDSVDDACQGLVKRGNVERERFIQIYGVDYFDHNNFNLVVDTTSRTPEEIVGIIIENYESYCADANSFISPKEV